jgi:hypothetical protein
VKSRFFSRSTIRSLSVFLVLAVFLQATPVLRASAPAAVTRGTLAQQLAELGRQIDGDLAVLTAQGKEAFLDRLFARIDADEARARQVVVDVVKRVGAKPLGMRILGIGSSILASVLSVVPESWQESIVISTLHKFIAKTLREVRGVLAGLSPEALAAGLRGMKKLVGDPRFANGQAMTGESWWEKFFGNSTIVRNFLIVVVTLASIGIAVGLAIAGSTTAPIVAVVGALVALIALMNQGTGFGL